MLIILFLALPELNHGEDQAKGIAGTEQTEEGPYSDRPGEDYHLHRPRRPSSVLRLLCLSVLAEQRASRCGSSSRRRSGELTKAPGMLLILVLLLYFLVGYFWLSQSG